MVIGSRFQLNLVPFKTVDAGHAKEGGEARNNRGPIGVPLILPLVPKQEFLVCGGSSENWNGWLASIFFLVSDSVRAGGVQADGGDGQKHQRMAPKLAQISTKAS